MILPMTILSIDVEESSDRPQKIEGILSSAFDRKSFSALENRHRAILAAFFPYLRADAPRRALR